MDRPDPLFSYTGPMPKFKDHIDAGYVCFKCKNTTRPPIKQLCEYRLCGICATELIADQSLNCPDHAVGNTCELLPDYPGQKEIKMKIVFCSECEKEMYFGELTHHNQKYHKIQ